MKPEFQTRIQAAADRFADEIVAVFGEAFASVVSDLAITAPSRAKPANARATQRTAAKPIARKAASKRVRRSGDQILQDAQRVLHLLASNKKGLRIENINKRLGASTRQLMRPIQKLLAEKKIRKTGEKRATTYFPA